MFKTKPNRNKPKGKLSNLNISKKTQKLILIVIVVLVIAIPLSIGTGLFSMFILTPTSTTPTDESTFTLYNSVSGTDVSDSVEIDVLLSKSTETFTTQADLFNITKFASFDAPTLASEVSIDMTGHDYGWIVTDPDDNSNYETTYALIFGTVNYDYSLYVYDLTSAVSLLMTDRDTLAPITLTDFGTDGNYTLFLNCPFDEIAEQCQAPFFNPSNATETAIDYTDALSSITNGFAIQITFNATVNITDTSEIIITVDDDLINGNIIELQRATPDEYIYLVFDSAINFASIGQLGLEITFGADVGLSAIDSGRLTIPGNAISPGTLVFTAF